MNLRELTKSKAKRVLYTQSACEYLRRNAVHSVNSAFAYRITGDEKPSHAAG